MRYIARSKMNSTTSSRVHKETPMKRPRKPPVSANRLCHYKGIRRRNNIRTQECVVDDDNDVDVDDNDDADNRDDDEEEE